MESEEDMKNKRTYESDKDWQRVVWIGTIVKTEEYEDVKEFLVENFDAFEDISQIEIIGTITTIEGVTPDGGKRKDFVFAIDPETVNRFSVERLQKMPDMKWIGDYYDNYRDDLPTWLETRFEQQDVGYGE